MALFVSLMAVALLACNGDDDASTTTVGSSSTVSTAPQSSPTIELPTSSTADTPSTSQPDTTPPDETATTAPTSTPDSSTTVPPDPPVTISADAAEAIATWQAAVAAAAGSDQALDTVASSAAIEAFGALERFIGEPLTFHTTATTGSDSGFAIEECLLTPSSETGALLLRAVVSTDNSRVESLDFEDAFKGCIPANVNEAVLAAYDEYSDAFNEVVALPDPDDRRLDQLVSGSYRSFLGELLTNLRADGEAVRGIPGRNPNVIRYDAVDRVVVGDCQAIPPDYGVYASGTGERTNKYPVVEPGQTDFLETGISFVDGRWKVTAVAEQVNAPCESLSNEGAVVVEATQ